MATYVVQNREKIDPIFMNFVSPGYPKWLESHFGHFGKCEKLPHKMIFEGNEEKTIKIVWNLP